MSLSEDPGGWEELEFERLEASAEKYGWTPESRLYKARLKVIQDSVLAAMRAAVPDAAGKPAVAVHKFEKPSGWKEMAKGKYVDKMAAKAMLQKYQAGIWKQDTQSPTSNVEGKYKAYRFRNETGVGGPYLARLVDLTGGTWRADLPIWAEEEEQEEEAAPPPRTTARRRARRRRRRLRSPPSRPAAPSARQRPPPDPRSPRPPRRRPSRSGGGSAFLRQAALPGLHEVWTGTRLYSW